MKLTLAVAVCLGAVLCLQQASVEAHWGRGGGGHWGGHRGGHWGGHGGGHWGGHGGGHWGGHGGGHWGGHGGGHWGGHGGGHWGGHGGGHHGHGFLGFGGHFRPKPIPIPIPIVPLPQPRPTLPAKLPPVTGSLGLFSWRTEYDAKNVRYIVFLFNGQSRRYLFPASAQVNVFLIRFQGDIGYVAPTSIQGSEGPISWKTSWVNGEGKVTFYYRSFVNGQLRITGEKTFPIKSNSNAEILNLLGQFKISINFSQQQNRPPPSDGADYKFNIVTTSTGQRRVTFYYTLYVDGQAVSSISKEYTIGAGADINSLYQQFMAYAKANAKYEVTKEPEVTGKISWKTKYEGGQHILTAIYTQFKGGKEMFTKTKDYTLQSGNQAEIDQKLDEFKAYLRG